MSDTFVRALPAQFVAKVVGVSFVEDYPENLGRLEEAMAAVELRGKERPTVLLRRNPDNEHDPNAVEVHSPAIGMIGHLPRALAARFAPELDAGERWQGEVADVLVHPEHPDRPGITVHLHRVVAEGLAPLPGGTTPKATEAKAGA